MLPEKMVDIKPLKSNVSTIFPQNSVLRGLILEEDDTMPAQEFVAKVGVWLKLLRRIGV